MRGKTTPQEIKSMIAALYIQGIDTKKIRDMFDISQRTVRRTLLEKGLVEKQEEPIPLKAARENKFHANNLHEKLEPVIEADTAKILTPAKSIDYSEEKEVLKAMICAFIDKVYMEG